MISLVIQIGMITCKYPFRAHGMHKLLAAFPAADNFASVARRVPICSQI